jgi:CUB domain
MGVILSPNFPGNYPNNADCKWLVVAQVSNGVSGWLFSVIVVRSNEFNFWFLVAITVMVTNS